MRILIINDFFECGGAEEYIWNLKEELEARGEEVHFLGFEDREEEKNVQSISGSTSMISKGWNHYLFNPFKYREIRRKIEEIDPDIIHLHNNFKNTFAVLRAVEDYPTVKTVHHFGIVSREDRIEYKDGMFKRVFLRLTEPLYQPLAWKARNRAIDSYIAPSESLKGFLEDYCEYVYHIPNFVPPKEGSPGGEHLLFVGRLRKEKGPGTVIEALSRLEDSPELKIAGKGPEKDRLEGIISEKGLEDSVSIEGFVDEDRLSELYKNASAVVIPSLWRENSPLVGIDALAYGKALLVSDVGGLPELVEDGENGFVFKAGDVGDLAEKVSEIMDMDLEKSGERSHEIYQENHRPEKHIERLMEIYRQVEEKG